MRDLFGGKSYRQLNQSKQSKLVFEKTSKSLKLGEMTEIERNKASKKPPKINKKFVDTKSNISRTSQISKKSQKKF